VGASRRANAVTTAWAALGRRVSYLHQRRQLVAYFARCHDALRPGGVLVVDTFGGHGAMVPFKHRRPVGSARYTFEQASYDAVTARSLCHIHFRFPDGSVLRNCFTYDWRRYSLPELLDAMAEAGFAPPAVWVATTDTSSGAFEEEFRLHDGSVPLDAEHWNAYVVARKL